MATIKRALLLPREKLMSKGSRSMRRIWLTLLASLLFASTAFAGDYSVGYANGKTDKGIVDTCKYIEACE
jgi:hypothetical protein